jgi:hypothetical protein
MGSYCKKQSVHNNNDNLGTRFYEGVVDRLCGGVVGRGRVGVGVLRYGDGVLELGLGDTLCHEAAEVWHIAWRADGILSSYLTAGWGTRNPPSLSSSTCYSRTMHGVCVCGCGC